MRHSTLGTIAGCYILLIGCNSPAGGPATGSDVSQQIIDAAHQLCGFVPAAVNLAALLPTVAGPAQAAEVICNAFAPVPKPGQVAAPPLKNVALTKTVNGIPITGHFE